MGRGEDSVVPTIMASVVNEQPLSIGEKWYTMKRMESLGGCLSQESVEVQENACGPAQEGEVSTSSRVGDCSKSQIKGRKLQIEKEEKNAKQSKLAAVSRPDCSVADLTLGCKVSRGGVVPQTGDAGDLVEFHLSGGVSSSHTELCCEVDDQILKRGGDDVVARRVGARDPINKAAEAGKEKAEKRRRLPHANGIYICGKLQGLGVTYTVDGGATDTLVAARVYKQIPESVRPKLQPGTAGSASGPGTGNGSFRIWGTTMFELQLGPVKLQRELGVADIKDDVLLGDNILLRDPEGPMDIMNSQNIVTFRGQEIPLEPVGLPKRALRLTTIDDEVIPGVP